MHESNEEILNELRIEVAKQKENIDSLKEDINNLEKKFDELSAMLKNGAYMDDKVVKIIKQNPELMDKIIGDTINKKFGRFVIGLISANIVTLITLILTLLGGE